MTIPLVSPAKDNYTILISGSRFYQDVYHVAKVLIENLPKHDDERTVRIVHGAARGVDMCAQYLAGFYRLEVVAYPADWAQYGKAAGSIRNSEMLEEENVDLVLAFPGPKSIGTWDMINKSQKANIKTIITKVEK